MGNRRLPVSVYAKGRRVPAPHGQVRTLAHGTLQIGIFELELV